MANLKDVLTQEELDKYGYLLMNVDTSVTLDKVILSEENRKKIEQFTNEMKYAEELYKYDLQPLNKVILSGKSGTGKTYLSRALATELNYYMVYIDIAQALSDASVSKNISDIFTIANKYKHCMIFFDEVDSIAINRESNNGSPEMRRATNSIFQYVDQMDPTNIFICASNSLHLLDTAFLNRFNLKLEFQLPELSIEETAHKFVKPDFKIIDNISEDSKRIIDKKCKLSYRELTSICNSAMKRAVIDGTFTIKLSDLYKDVAIFQNFKVQIELKDPDDKEE